jgi:hypothetical protein
VRGGQRPCRGQWQGGAEVLASLGLHQGWVADAPACTARSPPRAEVRGGQRRLPAVVAGEGQRRLHCLALIGVGPLTCWLALRARGPGQRWARAAALALLGSLCWLSTGRSRGGKGGAVALALPCQGEVPNNQHEVERRGGDSSNGVGGGGYFFFKYKQFLITRNHFFIK